MRLILCCRVLYGRIVRDGLLKESSALAYQSFMAVVPLLAVMFGIAKGFGLKTFLENWLTMVLSDHKEVLAYLLQFSTTALKQAQGGVIAGVGILFLLFTIVRLLASVERVLNSMWGFPVGPISLKRAADYMVLVLVCPLLLAISSSATIFISAQLTSLVDSSGVLGLYLSDIISIVPFVTSSMLFAVLLYALPTPSVSIVCALISGTIAAFLFQHVQSWYIIIQMQCTKISAVYGSFVALPLFLVWVWVSWFFLLVAGEVTVFLQERGWRKGRLEYQEKPFYELQVESLIYKGCVSRYKDGKILSISDLYSSIERPIRAITHAVSRLQEKRFVLKNATLMIIVPVYEQQAPSPCDLLFPRLPTEYIDEESSEFARTLDGWKKRVENKERA